MLHRLCEKFVRLGKMLLSMKDALRMVFKRSGSCSDHKLPNKLNHGIIELSWRGPLEAI